MNQLKILTALLTLFASASAFASPEIKIMGISKTLSRSVKAKQRTAGPDQSCTNFSGVYWGKCDSEQDDRELTIYQIGCEVLNIDGESHNIGSLETKVHSSAGYTNSSSQNLEWDDHDANLLVTYFGHAQFTNPDLSTVVWPLTLTSEMSLQGNKLQIQGSFGDDKTNCLFFR